MWTMKALLKKKTASLEFIDRGDVRALYEPFCSGFVKVTMSFGKSTACAKVFKHFTVDLKQNLDACWAENYYKNVHILR